MLLASRGEVTIGKLADVRAFGRDRARVRAYARAQVAEQLQELLTYRAIAPGGRLSNVVHSLGGPNEVDNENNNGPYWAQNARIYQEELWNQARAIPAFAGIPIAAPSTRTDLTQARAEELAGPDNIMQTWCDRGNPHLYQRGVSPTDYLDGMLALIQPISGRAPAIFTETGYNNAGYTASGAYTGDSPQGGLAVPEWVASVYAPRALGDFARRGAVYLRFELLDDPDPSGIDRESHFGIIRMTRDTVAAATPATWQRKPEFYTMQRLHNLLRDPGPAFTPAPLDYTVTDAGPSGTNLQSLLVQKRNGRHYLLLWRDVDVCRPNRTGPGTPISVAAVPITLRLARAATVNVYQPSEASAASLGSTAATAPVRRTLAVAAGGTFTVRLGGNLKVLEIF